MAELDKVIKALECLADGTYCECCSYGNYHGCTKKVVQDALELLNEQKQLIWELQEKNEYLNDSLQNAGKQKFIAYADGRIEPIPKIVRCKNCKHWWYENYCDKHGKGQTDANWFCADGELKE